MFETLVMNQCMGEPRPEVVHTGRELSRTNIKCCLVYAKAQVGSKFSHLLSFSNSLALRFCVCSGCRVIKQLNFQQHWILHVASVN